MHNTYKLLRLALGVAIGVLSLLSCVNRAELSQDSSAIYIDSETELSTAESESSELSNTELESSEQAAKGEIGFGEKSSSTKEPLPPPAVEMPVGYQVLGTQRQLPITMLNLKYARLRFASLTWQDVALVDPILGSHHPGDDPLRPLPKTFRDRFAEELLTASGDQASETLRFDVFSKLKSELALVIADAPGTHTRVALVMRGSLNVLMKLGDESGLVWVTQTDGSPAKNVRVRIMQGSQHRFEGRTDVAGLMRLPAQEVLNLPRGSSFRDKHEPLFAFADKQGLLGFTSETWTNGISPWAFDIPSYYWDGSEKLVGTVTAERGIYRPGDQVHLLGMMRERGKRGKLLVPRGKVELLVKGLDNETLVNEKVQLTRFGTFRHQFELPTTAGLGRYQVQVRHDGATLYHRFTVGKYRKVRFEVSLGDSQVGSENNPLILGRASRLSLPISARYLYGAPVASGKLKVHLSARQRRLLQQGFTTSSGKRASLRTLKRLELDLTQAGLASLNLNLDELLGSSHPEAQALDLLLEATVTDSAGDSVTTSRSIPVYRNATVVGLKSDVWVVDSKQGWKPTLQAFAAAGGRPFAQVELELYRRAWVSHLIKNSRGVRRSGRYEERLVERRTVAAMSQPKAVHFKTPEAGRYLLRARVAGQPSYTEVDVWVYGNGAYGRFDDHPRVALHADKAAYQPGETATLLVESPYPKARALVTLERRGVEKAFVQELSGAGTPIKIQLDGSHLPNVFASVALIPSGQNKPLASTPLRVAYTELNVSPEQRKLNVDIRPRLTETKPGKTVPVDVQVRDHRGQPIRAEVTLWAADEGVLKLTGYKTPDVFSPVYKKQVLRVFTSSSLLRYTQLEYDDDDAGGDSAPGSMDNIALRSRFLDTAFFSKGVVTGKNGKATINLPLPDNLTRWRVIAAGADRTNRFGSADSAVTVRKPLQVMPGLPRFLTKGDEVQARLLVQNNTGRTGVVNTSLKVAGATLLDGPTQSLTVARGAQGIATYRIRATETGPVRLEARAQLGEETDGFEITIPSHAATSQQSELVFDGPLSTGANFQVKLPSQADPQTASLVVEVAPTGLASVGAAVDSLINYPHGCLEQTTSRLIPMTLLSQLLKGHPAFEKEGHDARMQGAVIHLLKNQNRDGGFSLWEGGSSEPFLTAYALWGLSIARDHGYEVPERVFKRGLKYVKRRAFPSAASESFAGIGEDSFVAFALRELGSPHHQLNSSLLSKEAQLDPNSRALLATALGVSNERSRLLNELMGLTRPSAKSGILLTQPSNPRSYWNYGQDVRASAALTAALVKKGRLADAKRLVDGILSERNARGSWGTTFNNQWALFALAAYYQSALSTKQSRAQIQLGAGQRQDLRLTAGAPFQRAEFPWQQTASQAASIRPSSTDLGAVARLLFHPRPEAHRPTCRGLTVTRTLVDAETNQPVTAAKVGQLLRVKLSLETPTSRRQIALVDRLPAGLEPVDTALATSQSAGRDRRSWRWVHRELHDERVVFFANYLRGGKHKVSYLARASRAGQFVHPAARGEAMYDPDVFGVGPIARFQVHP